MIKFKPANEKWWNKPLVKVGGQKLPAELAILKDSLEPGEQGAWLNSRGTKTGAVDLEEVTPGKYKTVRRTLPSFVQSCLQSFYFHPEVAKGIYDLVLWHKETENIRFIEVKCPHWDRPTPEQKVFANLAREKGISAQVSDWEFNEKL